MGGIRGIKHYLQRTAIQGHPTTITKLTKQYQVGAEQNTRGPHSFRKHFEEIEIGDTVITNKHTVTLDDIENFAELFGLRVVIYRICVLPHTDCARLT